MVFKEWWEENGESFFFPYAAAKAAWEASRPAAEDEIRAAYQRGYERGLSDESSEGMKLIRSAAERIRIEE